MGEYDLKAGINFVKTMTGRSKVTFIGYSQGASQLLYAASKNPDQFPEDAEFWRKSIAGFFALAPITQFKDAKLKLLKDFADKHDEIKKKALDAGIFGLTVPHLEDKEELAFCNPKLFPDICEEAEKFLLDDDKDRDKDDDESFIRYKNQYPAGMSLQNLLHLA